MADEEAEHEETPDTGASDAGEREQARGGSGEPPVPDSESPVGADKPEQGGEEVTPAAESGGGPAEAMAHPGVAQSAAVQVPESHEAGVPDDMRAEIEEIMARYPQKRSASIPVLFLIQRRYGWCS